ncbi:MAG: MarR family transcriptional regulator [Pseudorhodoplanes sp.]|nr:MarR family transcriptional regulator [Pseudorhodoplanes sp.]
MTRRATIPAQPASERSPRARASGGKNSGRNDRKNVAIDISPLPDRIGYMLRRAQLAVFKNFVRCCAEFDIRPGQYAVLTVIENNPGLKQIDVSTALGIKRTNLVALIDLLEQRGFARREPVPADRRSYALHLTAKGKAFMSKLHARVDAHERQVRAALGEDAHDQLLPMMQRLIDTLGPLSTDDES